MRACVRVKLRFGRSAVAVSLRDRFKHFDLETGRFFHKTCQFSVIAASGAIFARYRSVSFFKRFIPEIVPFFRKPHQICHCEAGAIFAPDAAIFDGTICHPETNYGCAE